MYETRIWVSFFWQLFDGDEISLLDKRRFEKCLFSDRYEIKMHKTEKGLQAMPRGFQIRIYFSFVHPEINLLHWPMTSGYERVILRWGEIWDWVATLSKAGMQLIQECCCCCCTIISWSNACASEMLYWFDKFEISPRFASVCSCKFLKFSEVCF